MTAPLAQPVLSSAGAARPDSFAAPADPLWLPLADVPGFSSRSARHRWYRALPAAQRRQVGARLYVASTARLPDHRTVQSAIRVARPDTLHGLRVPDGALAHWSESDRERFLATHALRCAFEQLRAQRPRLTFDLTCAALAAERPELFALHNFSTRPDVLRRYFRRIDPASDLFDGNVDRRGRRRAADGGPAAEISPEAWELFRSLYLDQNKPSARVCWLHVEGEARSRGWRWPCYGTVLRRVQREIPLPVRVREREGPRAFESRCVPKIAREYDDLPAGHTWCGDERILDLLARVPDGKGGWRAVRPILTAWMDVRSRMFVAAHLDTQANSETILAAFRAGAEAHGLPSAVIVDNGRDYISVAGKPKRNSDPRRARHSPGGTGVPGGPVSDRSSRLSGAFAQLNVDCTWAAPFHPWSKIIESNFRAIKDGLDRLFPSFRGGSPAERPERSEKIAADVLSLPTLDELRSGLATALDTYHRTPHSGSGISGLTPLGAMQRYREQRRTADPAVLELLTSRLAGTRRVGRDGVRYQGVLYGSHDEHVFRLQGRTVLLRVDPLRADQVTLCELDPPHRPLAIAYNERLTGATRADVRRAAAAKSRLRRLARSYRAAASHVLRSRTADILEQRRQHALSRQTDPSRDRKGAGQGCEPAVVPVAIVRPDLVAPARAARRAAERSRTRGRFGPQAPLGSTREQLARELLATPAADQPQADGDVERVNRQRYWLRELGNAS